MILTNYKGKFFDGFGREIKLFENEILQVRNVKDNTFLYFKEPDEDVKQGCGQNSQTTC